MLFRSLNAWSFRLECTRVSHESLLMNVLTHSSRTMIWKEKERFRIIAVQMNNLKGLLGIKRSPGCTDQAVVRGE